ncbi:MAG: MFS transporter [Natronomonas sp.]
MGTRSRVGDGDESDDNHGGFTVRGSPRRGLTAATFGFFIGYAGLVIYGPAAEQFEQALGLSGFLLGILVAAPNLIGSLLRIPFGAWTDDVGAKKPFIILLALSVTGIVGLAAVLQFVGLDGLTMEHYPVLLLFGALSGCGIAAFSVGVAQTSYWYPANRQGTVLAVYVGLGNSSPGLFTILLPIIIAALGLTTTYVVWAVFLVVGTIVYVAYAVDPYYFQFKKQGLDRSDAKRRSRDLGQEFFPNENGWESIRTAAASVPTWALVALYFISLGAGFLALTVWFPSYWISFHGLEARNAGIITAVGFTLLATLIRIPGGVLCDRVGGERTAIASFGAVAVAGLLMTVTGDFVVAVVGMLLLAVGIGIANAAVTQMIPLYVPEAVGGASGLAGGLGAFGGFAIPPLLGLFVDIRGPSGFGTGFVLYLIFGVLGAVLSAVMYRKVERR